MLERFNKAKLLGKPFNSKRKENNTYLIRNTETGRIYYVQNYQELINVMQFLNPHLKKKDVPYTQSFFIIGKWECVIEESADCSDIYLADKRTIIVRIPESVMGLL